MKRPYPQARRLSSDELQLKCDDFNAKYPIGTRVSLRKDSGESVITKTRSLAAVLSGHSAVISVEGIAGCYMLDRVSPITGGDA